MIKASNANNEKIRFEALDGLRGMASLVVVLAHFCSATGLLLRWPGLFNSVLAVDTFFVLSGFVLAHSFLSREQRGLPLAPVGLIAQRWVRLWLPFAAATLIAIALRFGIGPHACPEQGGLEISYCQRWNTTESAFSLIKQLLFLYAPNLNAPSWTLPIEFLNSLLVPAFVLLIARSPGYLALIAGFSFISVFLPIKLPDCLYLFASGCALRHGAGPQKPGKWMLATLGISLVLMLPKQGMSQDVQQALMAPAAVALVLLTSRNNWFAKIFTHPISQLLGRLSFPIYLLHWPILLALLPSIHSMAADGKGRSVSSILISAAIYILITILAAIPFEKLIDQRSIQWGRHIRISLAF